MSRFDFVVGLSNTFFAGAWTKEAILTGNLEPVVLAAISIGVAALFFWPQAWKRCVTR